MAVLPPPRRRIIQFRFLSQNELHAGANLHHAIHAATQRWMGWSIGHQTSKQYGIPKGLPYLTGFVIHCEIVEEAMAD